MAQTNENPSEKWPDWFIETNHPLEKEVMVRFFQSNPQIKEIWLTINMMQRNYIVFHQNFEELARLGNEFNSPRIFREIAFQTENGFRISQDTTICFTRLLHNFLASSKMLVDVTRRWVNKNFKGKEFLDLYEKKYKICSYLMFRFNLYKICEILPCTLHYLYQCRSCGLKKKVRLL